MLEKLTKFRGVAFRREQSLASIDAGERPMLNRDTRCAVQFTILILQGHVSRSRNVIRLFNIWEVGRTFDRQTSGGQRETGITRDAAKAADTAVGSLPRAIWLPIAQVRRRAFH